MIMTLFDDDQILEAYAKDIADTAALQEARRAAKIMMRDGDSVEKIARCFPALSTEELKQLEAEVMQL